MHIRLIFARENRVWLDRFEPATSHSLREICKVRRGFSIDHVPVVRRIRHDGRSLSLHRRSLRYGIESAVTRHRVWFPGQRALESVPGEFSSRERRASRRPPTTPRSSPSPDRLTRRFRLTALASLTMSRVAPPRR